MRRFLSLALLAGVLLAGLPAHADPAGDDPDQLATEAQAASHKLDGLRNAESAAVEAANAASDDLARTTSLTINSRQAADAAGQELAAARAAVASRAVAAYKGGSAGEIALVLESRSPDEALERLRYLRGLGQRDRERLDRVHRAKVAAASLEAQAREQLEASIAAGARRDAALAQARQAVAGQQEVLGRLDARHRAAVQAAEARRQADEEAAARAAEEAAARAGQETLVAEAARVPQVHVSSEGLQRAIDTALRQVGTPYVWGGERPGGFDCSGLVRYAFLAAGVSVPHRADLQWFLGAHPARAQLQAGDLVFYSTDKTPAGIHHVGLYLGEGLMVAAPYTGAVVRVQPYDRPDYLGATRVIG